MITFLGLEHMVDATQNLRLGRVGWGGMITFLGLEHMVDDATQDLKAVVGWGQVSSYRAKKTNF